MKLLINMIMGITLLGTVGCGNSGNDVEREYLKIRTEFWTVVGDGKLTQATVDADMKAFRGKSSDEQLKLLESAKKDLAVMKGIVK